MSIQLQFVCEAAVESRLISWFSAGHFSHVDAVISTHALLGARWDECGGKPSGVQVRPQFYRPWIRRVVFEVPASSEQVKAWNYFLLEQVGKPYDVDAIWGFAAGRDWREPDSWICSELQAAGLEYAGIVPKLYLAANKITPVSLALAISAMGATVSFSYGA